MKILEAIWNFILTIDLREIVYAAVGAFLGFWLAIIMEKSSDKKKEKETIKNMLKNMMEEMKDLSDHIKSSIDSYNTPNENGEHELKGLFVDIPIYKASVQSGIILLLVDKSYYVDLLKTYSYIQFLSEVEVRDDLYSDQDVINYRTEARQKIELIKPTIEDEIKKL